MGKYINIQLLSNITERLLFRSCYNAEHLFCQPPSYLLCLMSGKCEDDGFYKPTDKKKIKADDDTF